MANLIPYVVTLAALALVYFFFKDPLRSIPGPFFARFTSLWMVYHSRKGDMHTTMIDLHKKYGDIVRTGPNEVSISDLAAIRPIYGAGSKFRKSDWYSVWQGHRKFDLFGERNGQVHGKQRRLVSNVYSLDQLRKLEPYIDSTLELFLQRLKDVGAHGKQVDIGKWAQMFAFDVIGDVTFSKRFGFLSAGKDDGSFAAIDSALVSASWIGQVPWLYWLHDFFMPVIGNWVGVNNRNGSIRQFAAKECEDRKARGSDHRDMLGALMEVHTQKPEEYNYNGVLSMANSNVFAGSDTTGITIAAILYYLCKYPTCKEKLLRELREKLQENDIDETQNVPFNTGFSMPYLQACIQEGLRMHPAVGMSLPRVVPKEGFEICGRYLPAGTIVGANPWVIHRNKDVFGNDCETFRPERWLEGDRTQMDRYLLSFGAGARICIGKNLSLIEITKLVPTLLLQYDFELANPEQDHKTHCWWFVKHEDMYMKFTPRNARVDSPTNE